MKARGAYTDVADRMPLTPEEATGGARCFVDCQTLLTPFSQMNMMNLSLPPISLQP
jgi:hypothetical protein